MLNFAAVDDEIDPNISTSFVVKVILFFTLFFLFFPYVTPVSFGTDVQPWGLFLSLGISTFIIIRGYRFSWIFVVLAIPLIASLILYPVSDHPFSATRSVAGYLTIVFVPLVFHYVLKQDYIFAITILKGSIIGYFVVALVQTFIDPNFMSFALNRLVGGDGRGVNSLSSEPTFYGLICLFLLLTVSALEMKNKRMYIYLLLFQIIVLSQSSLTILLLLVIGIFIFLFRIALKALLGFAIILSVSGFFVTGSDIDARVLNLARQLLSNPEAILVDGSINSRVGNIYFSLKGFVDNYAIPNGFSAFPEYWTVELSKQDLLFQSADTPPIRIMSFYGAMLFELGVFGALIPFTYVYIILMAYRFDVRTFLILACSVSAILFTAVPMSLSLVGVYFGPLLFRAESNATARSDGEFSA